jgi:predicted permease
VNVASLQLASAFARQREIAVRLALGASKARVVRQLVTESIVLGWAAGALGFALALWLAPVIARVIDVPPTFDLAPDGRVLTFFVMVSCVAGVGAGLAPARYGARGDLLTSLKGDGPRLGHSGRPRRLRSGIVGVQAAASLVLLVIASLGVRGATRAARIDVGFDADRLIAVSGTPGRDEAAKAYLGVALDRIRSLPGISAASLSDAVPFGSGTIGINFVRGSVTHRAFLTHTDASYFSTIGLRVLRGRTYTDAEVSAAAPVAVVSESLARRLWGAAEPIGQILEEFRMVDKAPKVTVIGVVSDMVSARLYEIRTAAIYRPLTRMPVARIVVRTGGPPDASLPALRAALQTTDPRVRTGIALVKDGLQAELRLPRTVASVAAYVAGFALALAAIGMYGVTAFATAQRLREIGVRVAVGASRADIATLLLRDSLRPVTIGVAAGVVVALIAGRFFQGSLYGISAHDPIAFAVAAVTLLAAGAISTCIPIHRAAHVDPIDVLRES